MTITDEKIFPVENDLAAHNAIECEMAATQDKNWVIIQEQLAICEQNFCILRDCDQLFLPTSNLILNLIMSRLISMIHACVKSYRSAFFDFA